ncbi:MAG: carboxypeptidase regulatory-like domain-containing protein, partial [Candidatus Schekmanbacteria bacterium]|nr:carboxypeptidase regulatory-like domain-containing protein [Candidatus Schekmanbacteria bacterium]
MGVGMRGNMACYEPRWRSLAAIAVVLVVSIAFPAAAAPAATVSLGGEQSAPAGAIAVLPVIASSAEPLGAAEFTLRYDPALLELLSVSSGAAPFAEIFAASVDAGAGRVRLGAVQGERLEGPTGAMRLAELRFRVAGPAGARARLDMERGVALAPSGAAVALTAAPARLEITSALPLPVGGYAWLGALAVVLALAVGRYRRGGRGGGAIAAVICAAALVGSALSAWGALGDVNDDGSVTAADAQLALAALIVGAPSGVARPERLDANGDGQQDLADVLRIAQLAAGVAVARPTLTAVAPAQAAIGDPVRLRGDGFAVSAGGNLVGFGGGATATASPDGGELIVVVPPGARSGPLTVTVAAEVSNALAFAVAGSASAPVVTGIAPQPAVAGERVTISGAFFADTAGANVAHFGGSSAVAAAEVATAGALLLAVPGNAVSGELWVEVDGVASNRVPFAVTSPAPAPVLISVAPAAAAAGEIVVLEGTGFAPSPGANRVWFSGVEAAVASSAAVSAAVARIEVEVPVGARTGGVLLQVDNRFSNELPFTVVGTPANAGAGVAGTVLDGTSGQALVAARVEAEDVAGAILTDGGGRFTMSVPPGRHRLAIGKDGHTTAWREVVALAGQTVAIPPVRLAALSASTALVTPEDGGHVEDGEGVVALDFPPGAVAAPIEVRLTLLPDAGAMPGLLSAASPAYELTFDVEPDGAVFALPVTARASNRGGYPPGTRLPLTTWRAASMAWEPEGEAAVSTDGAWIDFSIDHASAHHINGGGGSGGGGGGSDGDGDCCDADCEEASDCGGGACALLAAGAAVTGAGAPPYVSFAESRAFGLEYRGYMAEPRQVLDLRWSPDPEGAAPSRVEARASAHGKLLADAWFTLPSAAGAEPRLAFRFGWDARDALGRSLPTGVYAFDAEVVEYRAESVLDANGLSTGVTATVPRRTPRRGRLAVENRAASPYGAGWAVSGLAELLAQADGSVLSLDAGGGRAVLDEALELDPVPFSAMGAGNTVSLVADEAGNVYLTDNLRGAVVRIAPDGTASDLTTGLTQPLGLALGADGNLYVGQVVGIARVTLDGQVEAFLATGPTPGEWLAADSGGRVFVSGETAAGGLVWSVPIEADGTAGPVRVEARALGDAGQLAMAADGRLYVHAAGAIHRLVPGMDAAERWFVRSGISGLAASDAGLLVAVADRGRIYELDVGGRPYLRYRALDGPSRPTGALALPDGTVVTAMLDGGTSALWRLARGTGAYLGEGGTERLRQMAD